MTVCTRKTNIIAAKIPTIPKNKQATENSAREELRATHEVKYHSVIPAKDVMPLLPLEHSTPVVVKPTGRKEGEMPEAVDITRGSRRHSQNCPKLR